MNFPDHNLHNRIPISLSLKTDTQDEHIGPRRKSDKKRLLYIAVISVGIAILVSFIAKLLVFLINLITNISFFQAISLHETSPADTAVGWMVIFIPAIGGLVVGLMALYGSKAIRGHGIPEAMEQILTNKSKIRPSITYLKPLSSAVSIGTGGPFGAEGPIIATGGALGSTIGQVLRITSYERKILLAAGATAGMSAIFGSPIAAIFLAIELLLFEFSPRSIIPVALACITGAAGHHFLFDSGPVFPTPHIAVPGNLALGAYSVMGILIGFISAFITKAVYFVEDGFEKLPIHWVWWPAIGGIGVGIIGYFNPHTLGVGYENVTALLSGNMSLAVVFSLCVLKFVSWAVALGSGTSGGTLAPLLTIGGATGALLGAAAIHFFPGIGVTPTLAALVGMAAMFAGASRALLTSIIFAVETTEQSNALLPLLAAGLASYLVSYLLMRNTIMTEKIARRGVTTPHIYEPDMLNNIPVNQVLRPDAMVISNSTSIAEVRTWFSEEGERLQNFYVITDGEGRFKGIVSSSNLLAAHHDENALVETLIKRQPFSIKATDSLKNAVEMMAQENTDVLPVVNGPDKTVVGILSYQEILSVYRERSEDHRAEISISLRRRTLKILLHGKKRLSVLRTPKMNGSDGS